MISRFGAAIKGVLNFIKFHFYHFTTLLPQLVRVLSTHK